MTISRTTHLPIAASADGPAGGAERRVATMNRRLGDIATIAEVAPMVYLAFPEEFKP